MFAILLNNIIKHNVICNVYNVRWDIEHELFRVSGTRDQGYVFCIYGNGNICTRRFLFFVILPSEGTSLTQMGKEVYSHELPEV